MLKKKWLIIFFFFLFLAFTMPSESLAIPAQVSQGLQTTGDSAGLGKFGKVPITQLIGRVIGSALSMMAITFFVIVLYGGIKWMTAHGKEDQVEAGRDTIIQATVGLIIVVAGYALTQFVFSSATGIGAAGVLDSSASGGAQMGPNVKCVVKDRMPVSCASLGSFSCDSRDLLTTGTGMHCGDGNEPSATNPQGLGCCEKISASRCINKPTDSPNLNCAPLDESTCKTNLYQAYCEWQTVP